MRDILFDPGERINFTLKLFIRCETRTGLKIYYYSKDTIPVGGGGLY